MTQEQLRHGQVQLGPSGDSDEFADTTTSHGGNVQVIHGVHAHSLPISGMTVRQARAELEERLNLAPDALAVVDGNEADEDTVLTENQVLNFVKHAGEKGRLWPSDLRGSEVLLPQLALPLYQRSRTRHSRKLVIPAKSLPS